MKATVLTEPELEFGTGMHVDIRFGLSNYGPLDVNSTARVRTIRAGFLGSARTADEFADWLHKCRAQIPGRPSRQPSLFPTFPGSSPSSAFDCEIDLPTGSVAYLTSRSIDQALIRGGSDPASVAEQLADVYVESAVPVLESARLNILFVCWTDEILAQVANLSRTTVVDAPNRLTGLMHDRIKAKLMKYGIPIQILRPSLFRGKANPDEQMAQIPGRNLQDEASRAWNFFVACYYKCSNTPWRIPRDPADWTTCYAGVSFYRPDSQSPELRTSVAQVFNQRGQGLVIRGSKASLSSDDRSPHMTEADSAELMASLLDRYRAEHRNMPARCVIHKSSIFNQAECAGFRSAARDANIEMLDLVEVAPTPVSLFRAGYNPPLRGTLLEMTANVGVLYTRGSVDFYRVYPGLRVPSPVRITKRLGDSSVPEIAQGLLALTKMNWNNTQIDERYPVTLRASRSVGEILRQIEQESTPVPQYSYYM